MIAIRLLRPLLLAALIAGPLAAATAPTRDEWAPVELAIKNDAADAGDQLASITQRFPDWPDGHRELARWRFNRHDDGGALAAASRALELAAGDADAASLAIQSLTRLGRGGESFPIAERFPGPKDTRGWVNFAAAGAAFAEHDNARAEAFLKRAKERAGQGIPAPYHVLDSRLALAAGDVARAEASLRAAVIADPQLLDAWYELGRVQAALAESDPQRADEHLAHAIDSFWKVAGKLSDDYESWLGMGRCKLELGKHEADRSQGGGGGHERFKQAVTDLEQAIKRKDDLAEAHLALGEAHLRLEEYGPAVDHLRRAQQLGSTDRSLDFNLALALEKSGRAEDAAAVLASTQAISVGEKITKGMSSYQAGNFDLAQRMLGEAADDPDLRREPEAAAAVRRFVGHTWRGVAERAAKAGDAERAKQATEKALAAYRAAGDAGDQWAQRHYLALVDAQDPATAYAGGLTYLAWRRWLAPAGWKVVLCSYGESRAWSNPLHLGIWGAALGLPLLLWLKSLFRRKPAVISGANRAAVASATASTRRPLPPSRRGDDHRPNAAPAVRDSALEPRDPGTRQLRSSSAEIRKRLDR